MTASPKEVVEKINQQLADQDEPQEVSLDQLHFQKFTNEIVQALEKQKDALLFLSLNDCSLNTLENFPDLPNLIRLELTDNKISGGELTKIAKLKDLQSLSLGGNPIEQYKDLEVLGGLDNLVQLDLFGCPISEKPDYREKVFKLFSKLQILDNQDEEGHDVDYDDEEGEDEGEEGEEGEGDEEEEDFEEGGDDDEEDEEDEDDEDDEEEDEKPSKKKVKRN